MIASVKKNRGRPFHLLLGNGFSIAFDPSIFSYNALHNFVSDLDDADLSKILAVIETKNFELIMQYLDNCSALIAALGGDAALKKRIDGASAKLKASLLEAVKDLHPEHVFSIPVEQSESCSAFLNTFFETGGEIFSTNYDLLLYWVLMRNGTATHVDGCGRELENPDESIPAEEQIWSELIWGKHRDRQNVFYLHGALQFFDNGASVIKEEYGAHKYLLEKISARMEEGEYPIFVTAGHGEQKLTHIMHNQYLTHCYERFCEIEGSLVTFGFNFGDSDEHIIGAINKAANYGKAAAKKLRSVYIGVYSKEDLEHIEKIHDSFKCKVHVFDAKSANVWTMQTS